MEQFFTNHKIWIDVVTASGAIVFGIWQVLINRRLVKVQDFIALSIVPDPASGKIKLLNTGKINLYIHAFEIDKNIKKLDKGRLISSASLDSSYYWLPTDFVPIEAKSFEINVYIEDEFGNRYISEGGGESKKIDEQKIEITVWTYKTKKFKWNI